MKVPISGIADERKPRGCGMNALLGGMSGQRASPTSCSPLVSDDAGGSRR